VDAARAPGRALAGFYGARAEDGTGIPERLYGLAPAFQARGLATEARAAAPAEHETVFYAVTRAACLAGDLPGCA